ncbi:flagellin domain protein [Desulfonatronospira thiodismutans ASO3-1]|uniref:Flagellin n=1 Tax=Desulfonatronospira thiodismutans ASO3-1 TaxID=555779 RepID=D6SLP7_9BACT|nr:flagellin domain protein [Desulfonatronospira thiodismutans ASO3-1]
MSLVINTNMMAMNAARNLDHHYGDLATSTRRLSSGLRIDTAADDAAGLAIRELMRADIAAMNQGVRNANDGISAIQTADGALEVIDNKLIRMKELAEQAATGTYTTDQREIIDQEYQQMKAEINRIANATEFNQVKLLDGTLGEEDGNPMKLHFGPRNNDGEDFYYVNMGDATARGLDIGNSYLQSNLEERLIENQNSLKAINSQINREKPDNPEELMEEIDDIKYYLEGMRDDLLRAYEEEEVTEEFSELKDSLENAINQLEQAQDEYENPDNEEPDWQNIDENISSAYSFLNGKERAVEGLAGALTGEVSSGKVYHATVDGETFEYEAGSGDTASDVVQGLASLIDQSDDYEAEVKNGDLVVYGASQVGAFELVEGSGNTALDVSSGNGDTTLKFGGPEPEVGMIYNLEIVSGDINETVEYVAREGDTLQDVMQGLTQNINEQTGLDATYIDLEDGEIKIEGQEFDDSDITFYHSESLIYEERKISSISDQLYNIDSGQTYHININGEAFTYTTEGNDNSGDVIDGLVEAINESDIYSARYIDDEIIINGAASSDIMVYELSSGNDVVKTTSNEEDNELQIKIDSGPLWEGAVYAIDVEASGGDTERYEYIVQEGDDHDDVMKALAESIDLDNHVQGASFDEHKGIVIQEEGIEGDDATIFASTRLEGDIEINNPSAQIGEPNIQEDAERFDSHVNDTKPTMFAQNALEEIDAAIEKKDRIRADLGAFQNRLESTISNLQIQAENLQAAESRISDADVAYEMTQFMRNQVLSQGATAMLAQANTLPQMAMQLMG